MTKKTRWLFLSCVSYLGDTFVSLILASGSQFYWFYFQLEYRPWDF